MFTKQNDKKNIRRNLFRKMFPTETFDKKWTLIIHLPKKKRHKNSLVDDDNLSLLSGGTGSVISGMETMMNGNIGESLDEVDTKFGESKKTNMKN